MVIISNTFRLPGWQPDEVVELDDLYRTRVYRYVVGRKGKQEVPTRKSRPRQEVPTQGRIVSPTSTPRQGVAPA